MSKKGKNEETLFWLYNTSSDYNSLLNYADSVLETDKKVKFSIFVLTSKYPFVDVIDSKINHEFEYEYKRNNSIVNFRIKRRSK